MFFSVSRFVSKVGVPKLPQNSQQHILIGNQTLEEAVYITVIEASRWKLIFWLHQ